MNTPPSSNLPVQTPLIGDANATLFDPESIVALGGGDLELVKRLIAGIIQSNQDDLAALEPLLAKQDRIGIAALAHRTKGTARMINAAIVLDACHDLEVCAGHGTAAELRVKGEKYCALLQKMEVALRDLLARDES
ncbi:MULTISPECIES: Hpt domain-containing protein [Pseudomonas]|uniref:Hpt domain-containing protein n=1 Tax=Pseudomonas TaxID=286 RepID=UPI00235EF459|nr:MULTISPECIES: Hpt domain-containing protein [Pseudomonas]WJV25500.1 Hpt domain-containing protein [Pseudomonas chlororaphis]